MRVCILGAGVVGLASAYYLARDGHDVTVLEARSDAALETSFANGGQLSYSYVAPLADPSVLPKLPTWLLRSDSALRFVPRFDMDQWRWCAAFLCACRSGRARRTAIEMLQLGALSRTALHNLLEQENIDFDYACHGKLVVYRDRREFDHARYAMEHLIAAGAQQQALDTAACVALEPSLVSAASLFVGGIYTPSEEVGDCYRFSTGLAHVLKTRLGVDICYDTSVTMLRTERDHIIAASTARGDIVADAFVVSAGNGSAPVLRQLGVYAPIYPLTGYSLTLPGRADRMPHLSVTDLHRKIVYAPLGTRLRIAGMVDITGLHSSGGEQREALLVQQAQELFPDAGDYARCQTWCGHRPATPDGKPLIGPTRFHNLWLNTGHGTLGFTLACGSAILLADLIAARSSQLNVKVYALNR